MAQTAAYILFPEGENDNKKYRLNHYYNPSLFCGPCKGSGASLPHARCPAAILRSERTATRRRACLYLRRRNQHASANLPRFHGHEPPDTNPITLDGGGFAAIWIPAAPIDVAVFNSSGTQQYKVLNVTALPLVVTSLTANFFQSATTNPALSGFLRMGSPDQICWRNNGNSADVCLSKNASDTLLFNGNQFAFVNQSNSWAALQQFSTFCWSSATLNYACLTHSDTVARTYTFPDASGNVCLDTSCSLGPTTLFNGVTIASIPVDYDDYSTKSISTSGTFRTNTIPIGAVQNSASVGSIIEIETTFQIGAFTGSNPTYVLAVNGSNIATLVVSATGTASRYDVRCTIPLVSGNPSAVCIELDNAPATVNVEQSTISAPITGAASTVITEALSFPGTASASGFFQHVRIRK